MRSDENYKFNISLSKEKFPNKECANAMIGSIKEHPEFKGIRVRYGFKAGTGVSFYKTSVSCQELLHYLLDGHCFCHVFNPQSVRSDGTFGSHQKTNENFQYSQVIGIDVDCTNYGSVEEYVEKLSLKPSLYYTSYRNLIDGNGPRFRLLYVFDQRITSIYLFKFLADKLVRTIQNDTGETGRNDNGNRYIDECGIRATQYFNGTCKDNPHIVLSYDASNTIYSFSDLGYNGREYVDYLVNYCGYSSYDRNNIDRISKELYTLTYKKFRFNRKENRFEHVNPLCSEPDVELDIFDDFQKNYQDQLPEYGQTTENVLKKWEELNRNDKQDMFKRYSEWNKMRETHRFHFRKEKPVWEHDLYQFIDDDYFALKFYNEKVMDTEHRRKKLYHRMCLRRIMYPTINRDEMVLGTIIDIMKFFDNEDGVLNTEFIRRNIEQCFNQDIDMLKEQYSGYVKWLQGFNPKRGLIYKDRTSYCKETTYKILDDIYNPELTVKENIEFIRQQFMYFSVSQSTISRYLKDRGIKPDIKKVSDIELWVMIDESKSVRENLTCIKEKGYKVSMKRIHKILTQMKG